MAPSVVRPLPLHDGPLPTSAVFWGYKRAVPDTPPQARLCQRLAGWPDTAALVLAFDCPVESGNSGGPLLIETDGGWMVAAIMVARGRGAFAAFAVVPAQDLASAVNSQDN